MNKKSPLGYQRPEMKKIQWVLGSILLASVIFVLATMVTSADNGSVNIDNTRTALEKWVETQRIISKEKHDLKLAKEMLNERINLVQREIDSLQEKIKNTDESISEADKKRADLIEQNEKLQEASTTLGSQLSGLESRTRQLLEQVPKTVQDRVKPLSQRLPVTQNKTNNKVENTEVNNEAKSEQTENSETSDESKTTKLTLSERFQNVVGILNEFNKFHREIAVTSEVRTLADDTSAEVTVFYIGFGHAYYTGSKGKIAGIGTVSDDGWAWKQANEAASDIDQAIAIYKNEQVASFVKLPVQIQ